MPRWAPLLAVLAFLFQTVLVQAHVADEEASRFAGEGSAWSIDHASRTAGRAGEHHHDPATCPLCREEAAAGHYITPAPPEWTPRPVAPLLVERQPTALRPTRIRFHQWPIRGPPQTHHQNPIITDSRQG